MVWKQTHMLCFLFLGAAYSLNIDLLSDVASVNNMASWVSKGMVLFLQALQERMLLAHWSSYLAAESIRCYVLWQSIFVTQI